jgi:hypothetical protein
MQDRNMMIPNKTKQELHVAIQELQKEYDALKTSHEKDIIAYKLTLEALQESEERMRLLFENSGKGKYLLFHITREQLIIEN